ncbi:hypothetical protein K432DRAFT_13756 [Lepidopterella palustris CBS 459.81]|uniref:Uncharacterized protein n=1 Tax=Lepidopterella palustris CBS 459.81 TaxID=1314670 RepID=A0A8E2ECP8_9PEZI|nr:hypothetical protein K432DRAFT_13756 [Lepidopterella palustris CBS 459.81]
MRLHSIRLKQYFELQMLAPNDFNQAPASALPWKKLKTERSANSPCQEQERIGNRHLKILAIQDSPLAHPRTPASSLSRWDRIQGDHLLSLCFSAGPVPERVDYHLSSLDLGSRILNHDDIFAPARRKIMLPALSCSQESHLFTIFSTEEGNCHPRMEI